MSTTSTDQMAEILEQVKMWPVPSRIILARQILESVEGQSAAEPPPKKGSLRDLVGLLKADGPPPTDEECRAVLEGERIKKHLR